MLTPEKIEIFQIYKGYYDGYYIQNKDNIRIITDEEWYILENLIQDLFLIRKNSASKSFENEVRLRLEKYCDSTNTIKLVLELEKNLNK